MTRISLGRAGAVRLPAGLWRLAAVAWIGIAAANGMAMAQEAAPGEVADQDVRTQILPPATADGRDAGLPDAIEDVPDALPAPVDMAEPAAAPASDEPEDDGIVGLIEAPEGVAGFAADHLDPEALPDDLTGPGIASFAEVSSQSAARARMLGPIGHPPVVVELFTSQGCSSCPPADRMLADLAERKDVLALSWHVDYWDYLGWADRFARPEFTRRQQAYARASGERAIYTPQMILGGTETLITLRPAELMAMLQAQMARPAQVMVTATPQDDGYRIELTPRAAIPGRVAIVLVRYAPRRKITIQAGENRGAAMEYRNVVLSAERIAEWDGRVPLRMTVRPGASRADGDAFPADTRHAILAQEIDSRSKRASGAILTAIRLD
nr:DUF1223 domain-containing protein [Paracoccus halophilus]